MYSYEQISNLLPVIGVSAISAVLTFVAYWKIFVKMGEPGVKAIIPFYNNYTLYHRLLGDNWWLLRDDWFYISMTLSCLVGILFFPPIFSSNAVLSAASANVLYLSVLLTSGISVSAESVFLICLCCLLCVLSLAISAVLMTKLAHAFGHGAIFTVGLILLPSVFLIILAFSGDRYRYERNGD